MPLGEPTESAVAKLLDQGGGVGGRGGEIKGKAPAPLAVRGEPLCSVLGTPDERVDVRVGLAIGTTEVGIDRLRTEFGRCNRERDVILAGGLALAYPAGTDLGALRHDAVVRLVRRHLLADGQDGDLGADGE